MVMRHVGSSNSIRCSADKHTESTVNTADKNVNVWNVSCLNSSSNFCDHFALIEPVRQTWLFNSPVSNIADKIIFNIPRAVSICSMTTTPDGVHKCVILCM